MLNAFFMNISMFVALHFHFYEFDVFFIKTFPGSLIKFNKDYDFI